MAEQREIRSFGKMTDLTRERILNRLAESLELGDHLELAFQGGEPMLAGLAFYRALVQTVSQWDSRIHVSYSDLPIHNSVPDYNAACDRTDGTADCIARDRA